MIVAKARHLAEDAAPLVEVDYETTAACVDIEKALAPDTPLVHESEPDNVAGFMKQSTGNVEKAFAEADHVIKETLRVHRGGCHAIETRGIVAQFDPEAGFLTIWASCQGLHRIRRTLLQLMDMPEHRVRVIAPRVGGGFGAQGRLLSGEIFSCLGSPCVSAPRSSGSRTGANILSPAARSAIRPIGSKRRLTRTAKSSR